MRASDFDFDLPPELIATEPARPRDASRMLALDLASGRRADGWFRDLPQLLDPTDLLVLNDTRVIRARLRGRLERRSGTSREMELLLAEPSSRGGDAWWALARPGRRIRPGDRIVFGDGVCFGTFLGSGESGLHEIEFKGNAAFEELLAQQGEIPLPPYIGREERESDAKDYQTIYASKSGAVAAPTAGLHFTEEILGAIRGRGVEVARISLHVGIGTFLPLRTENPREHTLRPERFELEEAAAAQLERARREGRRIVAVGTTTTRTLEYLLHTSGEFRPGAGVTNLYILPGFEFKAVGALVTNFHLPRSTLLMLVAAFAGREKILGEYRHAVDAQYRFYSYGDCMFIRR